MKTRRFAAVVLAFCMVLSLLPGGAYAAEAASVEGWSFDNGVLTVTSERIANSYSDKWSANAAVITQVVIGPNVAGVSGSAFKDCTNLESFSVDAGNEYFTVENGVLYDKNKTTIVCYPAACTETYAGHTGVYMVPESVTEIQVGAFAGLINSARLLHIYACTDTLTGIEKSLGNAFPDTSVVHTYVPATDVSLNKDTISLEVGGTETLTAAVTPSDATFSEIIWTTESDLIATVDANGAVTGVSAGTTNIVATTADGAYTAKCAVTVLKKAVEGLSLSADALTLAAGSSAALTATVTPYDATYKTITFFSTDKDVLTVSGSGTADETTGAVTIDAVGDAAQTSASASVTVTAVGTGAASVVAITQDGGLYAVCSVVVPEVTLNKTSLTLGLDQTETLYATVRPGNAVIANTVWSSNTPSVATVDANGKITPKAVGTAKITVSVTTGGVTKTADCTLTVQQAPVTQVKLNTNKLDLDLLDNKTGTLTPTVEPTGTSNPAVTWSSSDDTIATVADGTVTAKAPGTAVITVTTTDGGYTASCAVTVAATRVTKIELKKGDAAATDHDLALNATETITAVLTPAAPTETGITWLSTDPDVVSITADGASATLKAEAVGSARIIAVAHDGAKTASCVVTVPVTAITKFELDKTTLELTRTASGGEVSGTLTATVEPSNATYGAVSWYSSDASVVTVSGSGNNATLTTAGPGRAAVVARTADGRQVSCAVTVWDAATGAGVSMTELTLAPGAGKTLYAVILPATADQGVKWSSDKESVATVDENTGAVTAVADGTATITATSTANSGIKAACTVTVRTSVTGLTLNASTLSLDEGETKNLAATVAPTAATNQTVTWISYNEAVATVDADGKVTAVAPGTTKILAVTEDGAKTAECAVTVNATKVTGVTLNKSAVTLGLNGSETLTATVAPATATNQTVTWESSDTTVVTVSNGTVSSGTKEGTATITATTEDGSKTATCTVTVQRNAVTRVTLNKNALTLDLTTKTSETLTATVLPDNASNKTVTWASSDSTVAEVSAGTVTAQKAGSAVITVTTADGEYTATCTVTVEPTKVTDVSLDKSALSLKKGDNQTLTATVSPSEATDKTVKWFSTNETSVKVDQSGKVKAIDPGTAVIIATTADGGFTAKCAVTVYQPVQTVSVHKASVTLNVGETDTLAAVITPENASKTVKWTSDNTSVATIDENTGVVTAKAPGTATITATAADDKTATCAVTVREAVTGVTLSETSKILELGGTDAAATVTLGATVAPTGATNDTVHWYSSDTNVAEVDQSGKVTAKAVGNAAIVAATDDGGFTASCAVTVRYTVTGVTLDQASLSLMQGKSAGLIATVTPTATADQSVTWSSSDNTVATVTNGVVVALAPGTATITATSVADGTKSAACAVTVTDALTAVESVALNTNSLTLAENGEQTLTATFTPSTASNQNLTWASTDSTVAAVDTNGKVTAKNPGTATILVTTADGSHMAWCAVTVQASVTGVTLNRSSMTLGLGQTSETLTAAVEPYNAVNKNLEWTITGDNSDGVLELSGSGSSRNVIPKKPGTATVKVTTADGEKTATCEVTVSPTAVKSATISASALSLIAGQTLGSPLTVTIAPSDNSGSTTVWTTSDDTVATVENGTVTATAKPGTALITATVTDKAGQVYTASCAVTVKPVDVTGLTLSKTTLSLAKGADETLTPTVNPGNATEKTVLWRSTNETVATVDGSGKVTAVSAGTAKIVSTTKDGGFTAECTVTVTSTEVTGITLDTSALSLVYTAESAESKTLTATVASGGANPAVNWLSSDTAVATVSDGVVTAAGKGTAVITAKVTENGKDFTATCAVTVRLAVTAVALSPANTILELGGTAEAETTTLTATVTPSDASDTKVTWYSSNSAVADVDQNGKVTAKNPGSAVITVTTADGGYAKTCTVTVRNAIREVKLNKEALTLTAGDTEALLASVNEGADSNVTWSYTESETGVITLNHGVITANKAGTATVTVASAVNSGMKDVCTVTVNAKTTPVTGVTLNKTAMTNGVLALNLTDKTTAELAYTVAPDDATNKAVTWQSTNTSVATVDANGKVATVGAGDTVIIVTTADGRFTDQCTVRVEGKRVTGVSLNKTELELYVTQNETLAPTFVPTDAANKAVSWSSSADAVAIVDGTGKVYARGEGTATITVTTADGAKTATCAVTVKSGIESITLPETFTLASGSSGSVTATVLPVTASNMALTWSSSDTSVATVDDNGVVTALKAGTTKITAKHTNTNETKTSNECTVTVTQPVTGVTLNKNALSLNEGANETLNATVKPSDANDKTVTWSSSDTSVADVDDIGKVTAKKAGTATISAKTEDGGFIAMCVVTVGETAVTGLTVSDATATLTVEDDKQLAATVTPSGATYGDVSWFSSDASIAIVNSKTGVVHAVAPGTAAITAATADGKHTASCIVTVESVAVAVTGVTLDKSELTMNAGESALLSATVGPNDATDKTVSWTSSAEDIATVDDYGIVTAKKSGSATITATAGGHTATCTVTVRTEADGVTLNKHTLELAVNATETLTATVSPTGASNKTVKWVSSDTSVATVDGNGTVKAIKGGTANIIVSTVDGGYTDTCAVTVPVAVTSVTPNKTSLTLAIGDEEPLTATVLPLDAADRTVTWSVTAGDDVVSVDANGKVKALKDGTATVTATAGGVTGTCAVTVQADQVTHVSLDTTALTISTVGSTGTLTATVNATGSETYTLAWHTEVLDDKNGDVVEITGSSNTVTIKALRVGTAKVTVSAGDYTAPCIVTVPPVAVSGVTLNETAKTLTKNGTLSLAATVTEGATNQDVTWYSSDESVATVSADGKTATVTAASAGTATVTVVTKDGGYTAKCVITVPAISLSKTTLRLPIGETEPLVAILAPAGLGTVEWTTSDSGVADVSSTGVVTAKAEGTATITAKITKDEVEVSTTCTVDVPEKAGVSLSETALTLTTGGDRTLTATVTPSDAANKIVSWLSTDTGVATVDANGKVTAIKAGSAAIIASTADGYTDTCAVTVNSAVTGVTLNSGALTLYVGDTATALTATVTVTGTSTNKAVTWLSSDTGVATVDSSGNVTAVSAGTAVIIATAVDGGQAAVSCTVTVWDKADSVTLNKSSLVLAIGDDWGLTARVSANSGTPNPAVIWTVTSGGDVVSVVDGIITARAEGTATVTATAADGSGKSDSCTVTVRKYVVSNAVDVPVMTISEKASDGSRTVTLTAAEGDEIWYYTDTNTTATQYTAAITISEDTTLKAYALQGSFQSAVVTGVITVNKASNSMTLTDEMGNTVVTVDEASENTVLSFTANITLADGAASSAKVLYLAVYDTEGTLVGLTKYEAETEGNNGEVIAQPILLNIPSNTTIGKITVMMLSADKVSAVMNAGTLGSIGS